MSNEMEIKIRHWRKYQTRTDLKSMKYFRLDSNLFIDPRFSPLSPTCKLVWIYLLSICAQSNAEVIPVSVQLASKLCGSKSNFVRDAIFKLEKIQLLEIISVTDACPKKRKGKGSKDKIRKGKGATPDEPVVDTPPPPKTPRSHWLCEIWNEHGKRLPKCRIPISEDRLKKIKTRVKDTPLQEPWIEAVQRLAESNFANGLSDSSWVATFDWFIKPDSLAKILEGKYDNRPTMDLKTQRMVEQRQRLLGDL